MALTEDVDPASESRLGLARLRQFSGGTTLFAVAAMVSHETGVNRTGNSIRNYNCSRSSPANAKTANAAGGARGASCTCRFTRGACRSSGNIPVARAKC